MREVGRVTALSGSREHYIPASGPEGEGESRSLATSHLLLPADNGLALCDAESDDLYKFGKIHTKNSPPFHPAFPNHGSDKALCSNEAVKEKQGSRGGGGGGGGGGLALKPP